MVNIYSCNLIDNSITKKVDLNLQDGRFNNVIKIKNLDKTSTKKALILSDNTLELVIECIDKNYKVFQDYDRVILYSNEIYWDTISSDSKIQNLFDSCRVKLDLIINFFTDKPFNLKNINYITTTGVSSQITKLYFEKYKDKILSNNKSNLKWNLICKFGRPNEHRIKLHKRLKDYDSFIYSINNFNYQEDYSFSKSFPSELTKVGDYKSWSLPEEDFQSVTELIVETRLSQFNNSQKLVTCSEKTLKGFLLKRPSIFVIDKNAFPYLEKYGFKFVEYFKEENLEQICQMDIKKLIEMSMDYSDIWEYNYQNLIEFIHQDENKFIDFIGY